MSSKYAWLAAFASGALLQFVSPPIGLHWLHWFSFVPLFVVLGDARRRNFRLGYFSGFFGIFFLFFWLAQTIDTFSNIPLPLAALIVALFAAVWGLPYGLLAMAPRPLRQVFGGAWVWIFPAVWVTAELVQPALFPYYQGVGQYRVPWVWQLASVFGAYGLTYLVLLTNCALTELWLSRGRAWPHLLGAAALWLANLAFGAWRYDHVEARLAEPDVPTVRVAILQQGVTMVQRLQDRGSTVLKSWEELTARAAAHDPDLVVWPEGSIYYNPAEPKLAERFGAMTQAGGFDFLVGGGTSEKGPDGKRKSWNSCYFFGKDGTIRGRYDKMVPLPFGEYLPWPFSYLRPYIEGVGNFQKGQEPTVFDTGRFTFTTPICYEAILDGQMRRLGDADVYLNITNDGWFGDTAAPHQHAMLAIVHAVEFGRPMIRVAYTGISMLVEPHGKILLETTPYTEYVGVHPLRIASFETPYRSWGRLFPWVCAVLTVGALFRVWRSVTPPPPTA